MVDDLVASKRLDSLPREEVTSLLGPGDPTDKWKGWDLVYWLGPERGYIRIDSEWLVLRFVVCVNNAGYEASRQRDRISVALANERGEETGDLRVVDESGEDYLFSADQFVAIDVSPRVKASLLKAPQRRAHNSRRR